MSLKKHIDIYLNEQFDKTNEKPLNRETIALFKYLNKNKEKYPKKDDLLKFIRSMMPTISEPQSAGRFYYEVYTQNYRPEGDYENITFNEFKNFKEYKQKRVTNSTAYEYSSAKIPFKGSNLEGLWESNNVNKWNYVVLSYEWYPIFLFADGVWYGNMEDYSATTNRQMSDSNPIRWNSGLKSKVIYLTTNELRLVREGRAKMDDISTQRVSNFEDIFQDEIIGKRKLINVYASYGENPHRASYIYKDIETDDGKLVVKIDIVKAGEVIDRKMVNNIDGLSDETKKNMEDFISERIKYDYRKYLTDDNVRFEFTYK
mgnify:CR=1 FL=1